MGETLGVDVVNTQEHLLEVELADIFFERTRVSDVIEELTASDHLLSDVCDLDLLSATFDHDGTFLKLKVFDDMSVIELGCGVNLLLEQLEGALVELWVIEAEDLEGILGAVLRRAELDLGREARTKGSSESESV